MMFRQFYLLLAAMLLLCLAPMPYGYFMLVRFVMMVACGWLAYWYYVRQKKVAMWVFGTLALLFQPLVKIALGRTVWNVIDIVVAAFLVLMFVMERRLEKKGNEKLQPLPLNNQEALVDNKVEFRLEGRLGPKELIYVASEEDEELTRLFESEPEVFKGWGQMIGLHVIYLPLLLKQLKSKEVMQYRAPYLTDAELTVAAVGNDYLLQYLEHPDDIKRIQQGFIRTEDVLRGNDGKDKAINRFYPISSKGDEPLADQLHRIGKQIVAERELHERLIESYDDWGDLGSVEEGTDDRFNSQIGEENTDDLIEEVKERIAKLRQNAALTNTDLTDNTDMSYRVYHSLFLNS